MQLVEMAEVEFFRVGSAAPGFAFGRQRHVVRRKVVDDTSLKGLRRVLVELAVEEGENEADLVGLREVSGWMYSAAPGVIVFDVLQPHVQYGSAYAACRTFPALEIEGRYFRLQEVDV